MTGRKINVLVVDDSAIVRNILRDALSAHPSIGSVSTAPDAYVARNKILAERPDVVTLDLEMPRMDGLTFLRKLMEHNPVPVIVISSIAQNHSEPAMEALGLGAVEVLPKPGGPYSVGDLKRDLPAKVIAAAQARLRREAPVSTPGAHQPEKNQFDPSAVIAIGASTGGVQAIEEVLRGLAPNCPGVVIALHIPAGFSASLAARMNRICPIRVQEAADQDAVAPGLALIAPGDRHLRLRRGPSGYCVTLWDGPAVCFQRPSVDVLFDSVAETAGAHGVGVLLTGMGADGANGLLRMRQGGARTIAQNRESCVIFGMPKEAIRIGAADQVLPLDRIAGAAQALARR